MSAEEKLKMLRAAVLQMMGVPDDKETMVLLLDQMDKEGRDEDILELVVALIETS